MIKKANLRILGLLLVMGLAFLNSNSQMGYAATQQVAQAEAVNINKASAAQLEAIRGIGPSLAQRIVAYRDEHGKFENLDDLVNVRGIGPAKLQKIKDQISM